MIILAGIVLGLLAAQTNFPPPAAAPDGFASLFDGRTAEGWREITGDPFPTVSWRIADGALQPVAGLPGFQDIRTVSEYSDFDLRFEWRISKGGNSGVKYRLDKVDRWATRDGKSYHARARGLEYQIVDDALNADARSDPKNTAGALYGKLPPQRAAAHPAGEWNDARIVVRGVHLEHWLNGVKVVECECAPVAAKPSPIALQNHNSEAGFRNLRIRRLP